MYPADNLTVTWGKAWEENGLARESENALSHILAYTHSVFLVVTLEGLLFKREASCSLQLIQRDAPVSSFKAKTLASHHRHRSSEISMRNVQPHRGVTNYFWFCFPFCHLNSCFASCFCSDYNITVHNIIAQYGEQGILFVTYIHLRLQFGNAVTRG